MIATRATRVLAVLVLLASSRMAAAQMPAADPIELTPSKLPGAWKRDAEGPTYTTLLAEGMARLDATRFGAGPLPAALKFAIDWVPRNRIDNLREMGFAAPAFVTPERRAPGAFTCIFAEKKQDKWRAFSCYYRKEPDTAFVEVSYFEIIVPGPVTAFTKRALDTHRAVAVLLGYATAKPARR